MLAPYAQGGDCSGDPSYEGVGGGRWEQREMGGSRRKSEEGSRARGGGTDRTDGTRKGSYGREGMSSTSGGVVAKRRRGGLKGRVRDAKPPKADRAGMKARSGHCKGIARRYGRSSGSRVGVLQVARSASISFQRRGGRAFAGRKGLAVERVTGRVVASSA